MIRRWLSVSLPYYGGLRFFFCDRNYFTLWILIEFNLLTFLLILFFLEGKTLQRFFKLGLFYFLVQSIRSMIFLFYTVVSNFGYSFIREIFILLAITIKIGLFPTTFWTLQITPSISFLSLYFLLLFQKIPYLLLFFYFCPLVTEIFRLISLFVGRLFILLRIHLDWILVGSSVASTFWVFYLFSERLASFFWFFLSYGVILLTALFNRIFWRNLPIESRFYFWRLRALFMFLVGLPPFSLFFFKVDIRTFLYEGFKSLAFLFFWLFRLLGLTGYLKSLFLNFSFVNPLYPRFRFFSFFYLFILVSPIGFVLA